MIVRAYFDTSYLAKLHWNEPGSHEVMGVCRDIQTIVCSSHGRVEFVSVGYRKIREKLADPGLAREVFLQLCDDTEDGGIQWLNMDDPVLQRAERFYLDAKGSFFLRASDALHLACAAEHGFHEIYSNDQHLLAAAPLFGLKGLNVIPSS
ncbi:MAG: type II toxin-antitoxin system VapC family toxin [Verrucomicrobiae bacterium]|nr:type II toxin-antitoxin system VapC family toxin [Verrucomicrobiae bacterium]